MYIIEIYSVNLMEIYVNRNLTDIQQITTSIVLNLCYISIGILLNFY